MMVSHQMRLAMLVGLNAGSAASDDCIHPGGTSWLDCIKQDGTYHLPKGTYILDRHFQMPDGVTIFGAGRGKTIIEAARAVENGCGSNIDQGDFFVIHQVALALSWATIATSGILRSSPKIPTAGKATMALRFAVEQCSKHLGVQMLIALVKTSATLATEMVVCITLTSRMLRSQVQRQRQRLSPLCSLPKHRTWTIQPIM